MLAIIAHHSVVNSGVKNELDFVNPNINTYFLMVWGMWGKTAINSFVLISGYFLCKGTLTWQRYVKLLVEVYFYGLLIRTIFMLTGYEQFSLITYGEILLSPLLSVNKGFTASFLAFYMFVPIYNILVNSLDRRKHLLLIGGLLLYFTIAGTFFGAPTMNEPLWYATLYMIAAYIRIYPDNWTESSKFSWYALAISVVLAIVSVIGIIFVQKQFKPSISAPYWFIIDSNKLLALAVGVSSFLAAKNAPKFYNRTINWLAAGTFGVLLIHTRGDVTRKWLWKDFLNVPSFADMPIVRVVVISLIIPIVIFAIGTTVDYFRRIWIEKPMMKLLS